MTRHPAPHIHRPRNMVVGIRKVFPMVRRAIPNFRSSTEPEPESSRPIDSRTFRLGIDYGTSKSKLVVTDYGAVDGEHSFLVRTKSSEGNDDYLIPSTVCATDNVLCFGFSAEARAAEGTLYRSLKMRCAYPGSFFGDEVPLPSGLDARDLATLYVGHLVALGRQAAERYAVQFGANARLGITLGVPMAQLDDERLYRMFVDMAKEAYALGDHLDLLDVVSIADAMEALALVRSEVGRDPTRTPEDWVRSEAEAALFWASRSPDVERGRYACVDVGAGTTSASWLHISAERYGEVVVKSRLSFYGAACAPPACDAVDRVLAQQVDEVTSMAMIRGREAELYKHLSRKGRVELDGVLSKISEVFAEASAGAFEKDKGTRRWRGIGRVFFLGGGAKLDFVREKILKEKAEWLKSDAIADPGLPADLTEEDGSDVRDDPMFMLVAYGLARRLGDVLEVIRPVEIPPSGDTKPPIRDIPSREEMYGD